MSHPHEWMEIRVSEYERLKEQYGTLHEIAVRVSEADNQRLAAEGEPGFQAMREMEDALAALHQFVGSNPASSRSIYEGTPKPHGLDCRCVDCLPAMNPEGAGNKGTASRLAGASASRLAPSSPREGGVLSHPLPEDSNQDRAPQP